MAHWATVGYDAEVPDFFGVFDDAVDFLARFLGMLLFEGYVTLDFLRHIL